MERGKILVVSWTVYPATTGSSVIVDNIADSFSKSEMVMLGEAKDHKKDTSQRNGVQIYYINPNVSLKGRGQKYLRWIKFRKLTQRITEIVEKEKCTKILAIFPDEFYMYAAYSVSKRLNIPFYTWFHNTYLDNRKGPLKWLAKRLQPGFFHHAKTNFVMSDGMLKFYTEKYPDISFKTLVHGFKIPNVVYEPFNSNSVSKHFLFSGGLNESCREATVRLLKTIIKKPDYHVHLSTGTPRSVFEHYGIKGANVHYEGFVDFEMFLGRFPKYDIMLLPHGFDGERTEVEYKTIFPTRTIPLLYSNRPILAHSPKNVFLTDFLRKNDCAEIVNDKDEDEIHAAISRLLTDEKLRARLIKNAIKVSKMFDIDEVSKQLRETVFRNV